MRVDGFFVVGRETPGGDAVFMQTYMAGNFRERHWGCLAYADRYLMLEDAKRAAENAPRQCANDDPATVWRVEVTATKEGSI